jgi:hypothetical protein
MYSYFNNNALYIVRFEATVVLINSVMYVVTLYITVASVKMALEHFQSNEN